MTFEVAKLAKEKGFEKPKGWYVDGVTNNINLYVNIDENPMMFNYSIGELLSILPSTVREVYDLHIESSLTKWYVAYYWIGNGGEYYIKYEFSACELIDTLYMMILKLKEEGVI